MKYIKLFEKVEYKVGDYVKLNLLNLYLKKPYQPQK
jgi:hypothetical protein